MYDGSRTFSLDQHRLVRSFGSFFKAQTSFNYLFVEEEEELWPRVVTSRTSMALCEAISCIIVLSSKPVNMLVFCHGKRTSLFFMDNLVKVLRLKPDDSYKVTRQNAEELKTENEVSVKILHPYITYKGIDFLQFDLVIFEDVSGWTECDFWNTLSHCVVPYGSKLIVCCKKPNEWVNSMKKQLIEMKQMKRFLNKKAIRAAMCVNLLRLWLSKTNKLGSFDTIFLKWVWQYLYGV